MLNEDFDEAVDRVTPDSTGKLKEEEVEREMRKFASDLVETVVNKVREEIYPAYLQMLQGESSKRSRSGEKKGVKMMEYPYEGGGSESPDTGTDDELVTAAAAETCITPKEGLKIYGARRRSVRFSFDDAMIPTPDSADELGLDTLSLKPVTEHHVTPVPSPVPFEMADTPFVFDDDDSEARYTKTGLVKSLLLRLLNDINVCHLNKSEILRLASFMDVPPFSEDKPRFRSDGSETHLRHLSSRHAINDLVQFTLGRILDDVKSGFVEETDLTALTVSIVSDRNNNCSSDEPKPVLDDKTQICAERQQETTTTTSSSFSSSSTFSPSAVHEIGVEVINKTITNVKQGRLSSDNLELLTRDISESRTVKQTLTDSKTNSPADACLLLGRSSLVDVLEEVKSDIEAGVINDQSLESVAQHLAMLPLQKNHNFSDLYGTILSLSDIVDLIKCALSDIVGEMNTDSSLMESDERGCNCVLPLSSSPEASGLVKVPILSHTANDMNVDDVLQPGISDAAETSSSCAPGRRPRSNAAEAAGYQSGRVQGEADGSRVKSMRGSQQVTVTVSSPQGTDYDFNKEIK